ncbi:MAG TPA: hypothetical protein VJR03_08575 [Nitrospira sp.]|nr:hypothetical protein [Nitrospira sp.]
MGPTKAIVKDQALYEATTGKLIKDGFTSRTEIEEYVKRRYLVLPVVDDHGRPWVLDGTPIYCLRGSRYETADDQPLHLARCSECGGMGIRDDEFVVESDCIRCTACGHAFDTRLEMMET